MANRFVRPRTGMWERVYKLLEEHNMTVIDLYNKLDFGSSANPLYERMHGEKQFRENEIMDIAKILKTSTDYLLLGIEDKRIPKKALRTPLPAKCPSCLGRLSNLQKFCNNCGQALEWDEGRLTTWHLNVCRLKNC